jgi:hypothetical protein
VAPLRALKLQLRKTMAIPNSTAKYALEAMLDLGIVDAGADRAREQPASRPALQASRPQQLQKLWRLHGVPILAALAHLDTDQRAL